MFRVGKQAVFFAGEDSTVSNLAPVRIPVTVRDGDVKHKYTFKSVEHGYQWAKLHWLRLHQDAELLLDMTSPMSAMKYARRIIDYEHHNRAVHGDGAAFKERLDLFREYYAEQILRDLILRKANQDQSFRAILSTNSHKQFVEVTSSSYWGNGLAAHKAKNYSEAVILQRGKGENRTGRLVGSVAEQLRWEEEAILVPLNYAPFFAGYPAWMDH